jgi:citrate synthase
MASWLTREEAMLALGVRAQTLYAYVSRGRIGAKADPADPRRSLYSADDVAALTGRRRHGRRVHAVAAGTIAWGEPVLDTAISAVSHGRLFYRSRDAVALAETTSLEETAALLVGEGAATSKCGPAPASCGVAAAFAMLAERAATDRPSHRRTMASLGREAAELLQAVAAALGADPAAGAIHLGFARAWARPDAADAVRRVTVLLADHELNASTFAARVAASTGAALAACMLAGLATLSGPLHGAAPAAMRMLADDAARVGTARAVRDRLDEGRPLPGFGHPLYAGIDPRAEALLAVVDVPAPLAELARYVEAETGLAPNIDFALTAVTAAYALPAESPLVLFAAARTAGWLAHAIEQATTGALIRPRARYVGPTLAG